MENGVKDAREAFAHVRNLAESEDWRVREVAATALGLLSVVLVAGFSQKDEEGYAYH